MDPVQFFSTPAIAEITMLLIASSISEEEKEGWLTMLPLMTAGEHEELAQNLREEIADYLSREKQMFSDLSVYIEE